MRSGRRRPSAVLQGLLLVEVAVVHHVGEFDDAAQLDFSPASANVRRAQGLHQLARLELQIGLRADQRCDLSRQRSVGFGAFAFHGFDLFIHFVERVGDGFDEGFDGFPTIFELAGCSLLKSLQLRPCQFEESCVVALQRFGGERLEGVLQIARRPRLPARAFLHCSCVPARAWRAWPPDRPWQPTFRWCARPVRDDARAVSARLAPTFLFEFLERVRKRLQPARGSASHPTITPMAAAITAIIT